MSSAGSHNPILVPWGHHCSRVELVTTVVVYHDSTNPTNDQAHCFPNVPLRDRERSSAASASEGKVERIDLRLLSNQQVRAFAHSAPALHSDDSVHLFDSTNLALASKESRRSNSGGTLQLEDNLIAAWSRVQPRIASKLDLQRGSQSMLKEPSIRAVAQDLRRLRSVETIIEASKKYDSHSQRC